MAAETPSKSLDQLVQLRDELCMSVWGWTTVERDGEQTISEEHMIGATDHIYALSEALNDAVNLLSSLSETATRAERERDACRDALRGIASVAEVAARSLRSEADLRRTGGFIVDANCDSIASDVEAAIARAALGVSADGEETT